MRLTWISGAASKPIIRRRFGACISSRWARTRAEEALGRYRGFLTGISRWHLLAASRPWTKPRSIAECLKKPRDNAGLFLTLLTLTLWNVSFSSSCSYGFFSYSCSWLRRLELVMRQDWHLRQHRLPRHLRQHRLPRHLRLRRRPRLAPRLGLTQAQKTQPKQPLSFSCSFPLD